MAISLTYQSSVFQFADCVAGRECKFNDKARQKAKVTCYKLQTFQFAEHGLSKKKEHVLLKQTMWVQFFWGDVILAE